MILAPLLRGLFFASEQLWTEMWLGALLALLGLTLLKERKTVSITWTDVIGLAFIASYLITIPRATSPVEAREVALLWAGGYALYWAVARGLDNDRSREGFVWAVYAGALLVALVTALGALGYLTVLGDYQQGRLAGPFQYANATAAFFMVMSLWGWGLFLGKAVGWRQGFVLAANTLFLLLILSTQSRGVWVIYPVMLALGMWRLSREDRAKLWPALGWSTGVGLLLTAPLLGAMARGQARTGLALLVIILFAGYIGGLVPGFLSRWEPRKVALLRTLSLVYLAGVLIFYALYVSTLPGGEGSVVPAGITARASAISTQTHSVQDRFYFSVTALKIAKAHPWGSGGGAFNALYHRFQRVLFYSTQAHDGYAQVLVEAGVPGLLLFLGLWYLYLRRLRWLARASPEHPTAWLVGVGILALGIHSLMDFDLTFGAMAFLFWVGLALTPERRSLKLPVGSVLPLLGGALLFLPAYNMYQGESWGAQGAQAMRQGHLAPALADLNQAKSYEPDQATFWFDEAQIRLVEGNLSKNTSLKQTAISDLGHALALNPTDLPLRERSIQLFLLANRFPEAVANAQELVRLDPWDPLAYDTLAQTLVVASSEALEHASPGTARRDLTLLASLPGEMAAQNRSFDPGEGRFFNKSGPLVPDDDLRLSEAQGDYLSGRFAVAARELTGLQGTPGGKLATVWLVATDRHLGTQGGAVALPANLAKNSALLHESDTIYRLGFYLGG